MRTISIAILALLTATPLLAQDNREPAPVEEIQISTFDPKGILPSDARAFVSLYESKLARVEKLAFENRIAQFEKEQAAFEKDHEAAVKQALVDLPSPERLKILDARNRLIEAMKAFPSSTTFFRDSVAILTPENAERLTGMIYDFDNARTTWLTVSNDVIVEMKLNMGTQAQIRTILGPELQAALDLRKALGAIKKWQEEALAAEDRPQMQTMLHILDFHQRHDARSVQRLQDRIRPVLGDDLMRSFNHKIYEHLPQRPKIVK